MRFTDEDLQEHFNSYDHEICHGAECKAVKYLLARLEAAELCASQFAASFPDHAVSKAWRKAAGE